MNDFCQFLKPDRSGLELDCTAGVNFSSVGTDRALCRVCPLTDLGGVPLCPNVDVYTFLRNGPDGATVVEVEYACLANADLSTDARCQNCADRPSSSAVKAEQAGWFIPTPK